jgi:hypothetical protein
MARSTYDPEQLAELLMQELQSDLEGIEVSTAAVECAVNDELREAWEKHLRETCKDRDALLGIFSELGLDPKNMAQGGEIAAQHAHSLVRAIRLAQARESTPAGHVVASATGALWPEPFYFPVVLSPGGTAKHIELFFGAPGAEQSRVGLL